MNARRTVARVSLGLILLIVASAGESRAGDVGVSIVPGIVIKPNPVHIRGTSAPTGPDSIIFFLHVINVEQSYLIRFVDRSPFAQSEFILKPNHPDDQVSTGKATVESGEYEYTVSRVSEPDKVVSRGKVIVDSQQPGCTQPLTNGDTQRPTVSFTIADETGLKVPIQVKYCTNAELKVGGAKLICHSPVAGTIGGFANGATSVDASIRKIFDGPTIVRLQIFDLAGNSRFCDPVLTQVVRSEGKPIRETYQGLPQEEGMVTIHNGDPGLSHVEIVANGLRFRMSALRPGEVRDLDISSAMMPGEQNIVSLKATGKPGGSALLMIWDGVR